MGLIEITLEYLIVLVFFVQFPEILKFLVLVKSLSTDSLKKLWRSLNLCKKWSNVLNSHEPRHPDPFPTYFEVNPRYHFLL